MTDFEKGKPKYKAVREDIIKACRVLKQLRKDGLYGTEYTVEELEKTIE